MTLDRIGLVRATWFGCRMKVRRRRYPVGFDVTTMTSYGERCKDPAPFEPGREEQA